jgi:hypothetical protein
MDNHANLVDDESEASAPADGQSFQPMCAPCVTVDVSQVDEPRDADYVPPIERIITPRDVTDIQESDEVVYILGTKDNKVTCIRGLEGIHKLKVSPPRAVDLSSAVMLMVRCLDRSSLCDPVWSQGWKVWRACRA